MLGSLLRPLLARSSLLFGLMHFTALAVLIPMGDALLFSLPAVAAGFVWGWMRGRFGGLWPGVVTHAVADASVLLLFYAA